MYHNFCCKSTNESLPIYGRPGGAPAIMTEEYRDFPVSLDEGSTVK
jgi:hypothetical protein